MLGFVIHLLVLLWAFAEPPLVRLWLVLAGTPLAGWVGGRVLGPGSGGGAA